MELQVEITKVTVSEYIDRDNQKVQRATCEAREINVQEGKFTSRVVFNVYDAAIDTVHQGAKGIVTVNVERKDLTTRDGRPFSKNDATVSGWRLTEPGAF